MLLQPTRMLNDTPLPLLQTQLAPPRPPRKLLPRPALLDRLGQAQEGTLSLVCASPGSGKTTLLGQWRKQLLAQGKPVAWLSLSASENDTQRFFAALAAALHGADPTLGERLRLLLAAGGASTVELLAALFCNEVASHGNTRIILILDDLQRIHNPDIDRGLGFILAHAPGNLHITASSRSRPHLSLMRLQAYDQLTELHSHDLSLSLQDTRALIQLYSDKPPEEESLQDLHQRTEGWLTGLMMAIRLLKRRPPEKTPQLAKLGGHVECVRDYFEVMVLSQHPPELTSFLRDISVLETFDAELCDDLRQREDAERHILALLEHNLFVQATADSQNRYRLQPLFADYLRACLQSDSPERIMALRRRAMQWYTRRREWRPAVEHALACDDTEQAVDLVEKCAMSLVRHSDLLTLVINQKQK